MFVYDFPKLLNVCSYVLEDPFTDIPTMIRFKIADYTLSKLVEKV